MLLAELLYVAQIIDNSFSSDCFILIICLRKKILFEQLMNRDVPRLCIEFMY